MPRREKMRVVPKATLPGLVSRVQNGEGSAVIMDAPSRSPQDAMKRSLFISMLVAGVPALVLAVMIFTGPGEKKGPAEAKVAITENAAPKPEVSADKEKGTFLPKKSDGEKFAQFDRLRDLLDRICKEEERMAARIKRVLDEPGFTEPKKKQLLSELAHRSGKENVEAASEMLDAAHTIPAGPLRVALYSGVLQTRAEIDPEESLKLCGVLHEREDQRGARNFVVRHWALRDFEAATRAVERLEFPEDRLHAAEGLVVATNGDMAKLERELARKDLNGEVAAALAAFYGLHWPGELDGLKATVATSQKPQVMAAIMGSYATRNPAEALPYFQNNPEMALPETAVVKIAYQLAAGNVEESLVTLLEGAAFKSRLEVVKATFSRWMMMDLKAAGEWLRTRESSPGSAAEADELRMLMFTAMKTGGATESARAWAERISDPAKRAAAVKEVE